MTIYYFNPENDLALASGAAHYTPPARAAALRDDLRLLPVWMASPGDCVLCAGHDRAGWLARQGLGVDIVTPAELPSLGHAEFAPWGWSRAMWQTLRQMGAPERLLPTAERVEAVHRLSHRRTTIAMHRTLQALPGCAAYASLMPVELTSMKQVRSWAERHIGGYLKLPWSGSGQGVYRVLSLDDTHLWQWCRGGLRRQGTLLCEPGLDRVRDFASEWRCSGGKVTFLGWSVFDTDFHHQFVCGHVDTRQALHARLAAACPGLDAAVEQLRQAIALVIAPSYDGPLGVDMMLYRTAAGRIELNPCVEVNLRYTMGHVACALGNRHGRRGLFKIFQGAMPDEAVALTPPARFTAALVPGSAALIDATT